MIKNLSKNSYFITTPIFYVNAVPHIGHLYSALLADAQSRWRLIKGFFITLNCLFFFNHLLKNCDFHYSQGYKNIVFSTGTDEHGYKIQKKAASEKIECSEYCGQISGNL